MENNMWLIDAYVLWNEFEKRYRDIDKGRTFASEIIPIYDGIRLNEIEHGISLINNATPVDAVEVVRCKDCIYRGDFDKCPLCWQEWHDENERYCGYFEKHDETIDNGFCYKGAKGR